MNVLSTIVAVSSNTIDNTVSTDSTNKSVLLAVALSTVGAGFFLNKKGKKLSKFHLKLKLAGLYIKSIFSRNKSFTRKKDINTALTKIMIGSLICIAGLVISLSSTGFWLIIGILVLLAGIVGIGMGIADTD